MATDVTMPRLSDSMEEGTVLKWLVEVGGEVKRGEPLVEIETDKANMTYEADADGTLIEVLAQEGDTLAIGELIARIGEAGEAPAGNGQPAAKAEPAAREEPASDEPAPAEPEPAAAKARTATKERPQERAPQRAPGGNGDGGRVKASPVARRMARELGVELARLEGSGPGGRIVKADVQAAADSGGAAPAAAPVAALARPSSPSSPRPSRSAARPARRARPRCTS